MKSNDQTLQVEVAIAPAKGRKGGQRRTVGGRKVPDPPRIPRITRLMALAIKFQDTVDRGEVHDYADIARLGYVSRARITQIMNLLNLAPNIQEQLLLPAPLTARIDERRLRRIVNFPDWIDQRQGWAAIQLDPRSANHL